MPVIEKRSVLSGITVQEAMRRQVIILPQSESIDNCINRMIKYKVNAVVVSNNQQYPVGVVSKTDIMGAYYAGFAVETPLENIMAGPPVFSYPDDELEASLEIMQENGIHRVYVLGADSRQVVGVLSYPDIVGLIYRYCLQQGVIQKKAREERHGIGTAAGQRRDDVFGLSLVGHRQPG